MDNSIEGKLNRLIEYFSKYDKAVIAFSGGVDSCFLLRCAQLALGKNAVAVTASFNSFQKSELDGVKAFCSKYGIENYVIEYNELEIPEFVKNTFDRCYYCKRELLKRIIDFSADRDINDIFEGSNADDDFDYRPGAKAIKELGIKSPLKELGFTKSEIRTLSKKLGIPQWSKPSLSCLATRIAYGEPITEDKLSMIYNAESYILSKGFTEVRVRLHSKLARIELPENEICRLIDDNLRKDIYSKLKSLGFVYISLDLSGYENGSMNKEIENE